MLSLATVSAILSDLRMSFPPFSFRLTLTATGVSASPKLCTARLCRFESSHFVIFHLESLAWLNMSQPNISSLVLVSAGYLKDWFGVLSCISNLGALLSRRGHFLLKWDEADRRCVYLPTHNFEWWVDTVSDASITSKLISCHVSAIWCCVGWKMAGNPDFPWLFIRVSQVGRQHEDPYQDITGWGSACLLGRRCSGCGNRSALMISKWFVNIKMAKVVVFNSTGVQPPYKAM